MTESVKFLGLQSPNTKKKRNFKLEWIAEINTNDKIKDNQLPNVGDQDFHSIKRISKNN